MLQVRRCHGGDQERPGTTRLSGLRTYETAAGVVFLQCNSSPALIESLQADEGLCAFARLPEREHLLLLSIARQAENRLTIAYSPSGKIVGQATLAPLDDWWQGIGNAYEIAVEVSPRWRNLGLAHQLLSCALEMKSLEEYLIVGLGLSWHWDYAGMGMSRFAYREMIARLFAAYGFVEYLTSEPNIRMDPANVLLARLGRRLAEESVMKFFERLLASDTLPGL